MPAPNAASFFPNIEPRHLANDTYFQSVFKKVPLSLRIPRDIRDGLLDLVKLWKHMAKVRGEDADEVDISFVAIRLLRLGVDGAFAEIGGRPKNDAEWKVAFEKLAGRTK